MTTRQDIRRFDFPKDHPRTPGEAFTFTEVVREEDSAGAFTPPANWDDYDANGFRFWMLSSSNHKATTDAELDTACIFKCKEVGADGIVRGSVPNVDITVSAAKSVLVKVTDSIWYEFWGMYQGQSTRLAYGLFPWVD